MGRLEKAVGYGNDYNITPVCQFTRVPRPEGETEFPARALEEVQLLASDADLDDGSAWKDSKKEGLAVGRDKKWMIIMVVSEVSDGYHERRGYTDLITYENWNKLCPREKYFRLR